MEVLFPEEVAFFCFLFVFVKNKGGMLQMTTYARGVF